MSKAVKYGIIANVRVAVGREQSCAADETAGLHGQAVKTSPFHGGNTGSIPVGVILVYGNHFYGNHFMVPHRILYGDLAKW